MLTGRESLVRLIGRRRRSPLPASLAALLSPSSPAPAQANVEGSGSGEVAGPSSGGGAEWVACPICGESIRGSDYCVNTHLDICLTRGAKRKLTQSSLLNFRFSKKVAVEPTLKSLDNVIQKETPNQIDKDSSSDQAFFSLDSEIGSSKASATISSTGCLDASLDICDTFDIVAPPNIVSRNVKDAASNGAVENSSSDMLQTVAISSSTGTCADTNSISTVTVDTMIVGRKFHESIELQEGASIIVQREPQNAKDSDAIKHLNVRRCLDTCLESSPKFWLLYLTNIMLNARGLWWVCLNNSMIVYPSRLQFRNVKLTTGAVMIYGRISLMLLEKEIFSDLAVQDTR